MKDDRDDLLRVATSVADGSAVDWDGESRTHEHLRRKLHQLRAIEKIAVVHRSPAIEKAEALPTTEEMKTRDLTAEESQLEPPPLSSWGPLRIVERIGRGGHADVYRAYDPRLQKEVALKLIRSDRPQDRRSTKRFLEEARRLARVRHPNVLVVHGADIHEGRAGLWTDLVRGKTLETLLEQQGPLGSTEAAGIGVDLCRALAAVHAAGVVHHDVKTNNIMREEGGRIILMDFSSGADRVSARVPSGSDPRIGTPLFMAPERFSGKETGTASDIYSLGVVLYRLVSRKYPIAAETVTELSAKHRRGEWVRLRDVRPDLPPGFVRTVERALEPDPDRRYTTAGETERALCTVLGYDPPSPTEHTVRPWWRQPVFVGALAATVALAAGVGVVILLGLWPTPFKVEAFLYRIGNGTEERLLPGGRVSPGDKLFLEIKGSKEMNVYALNEDIAGESFVLFPLPGLDLQNPLAPETVHRLPGTVEGVSNYWDVTSAGGQEAFLVIASREPLEEFEREIAHFPRAGSEGHYDLTARAAQILRGIGGLTEVTPQASNGAGRPLSGIFQGIKGRAANESGIWAWEFHLDNPGP